jgi:hypothetical protein
MRKRTLKKKLEALKIENNNTRDERDRLNVRLLSVEKSRTDFVKNVCTELDVILGRTSRLMELMRSTLDDVMSSDSLELYKQALPEMIEALEDAGFGVYAGDGTYQPFTETEPSDSDSLPSANAGYL